MEVLNQYENDEIINFFSACDEFIEGKFILADIKIAKILRAISESSTIYDLIAESLINYDFNSEYDKTMQDSIDNHGGVLTLKDDAQQVVPFVFSLLVEIDSKQISFNEFLASAFINANSQKEEYEVFAKQIIVPFKNAVAELLGIDINEGEEGVVELVKKEQERIESLERDNGNIDTEEIEEDNEDEEDDEEKLLFDRINRMASIINDKLIFINKPLKRSNLELLVNALQEACKIKNITILIALVMSLNELAYKERKFRKELDEINAICFEFYK